MIEASAPGKILLFGEHAVVYGAPAIGLPLSRGVSVTLEPGRGRLAVLLAPGVVARASKLAAQPEAIVRAVFGARRALLDVSIGFQLAPMAGFGTSASLAIALLRAKDMFDRALDEKIDRRPMLVRALEIESLAHGTPSGADPASCLATGPILFQRRGLRRAIRPLKIRGRAFLLVGNAGSHGGAARAISRLASLRREDPALVKSVMTGLGAIATSGARALSRGDFARAGALMSLAHGTLSGLDLVAPGVRDAVTRLHELDALGAKMSGAGGAGGAFVALFDKRATAERATRLCRKRGLVSWVEVLG